MRKTRAAVALVFLLFGIAALGGGAAADGPTTAGDTAEAWYASTPLLPCTSPVGCPPVAAPPAAIYPADTLHVGVAAGSEVARSYVEPDLSAFGAGALPSTGTMTLPLSNDPRALGVNVPGATLIACLVVSPFTDGAQGSTGQSPATDCTVVAPATYRADEHAFTVDLAPFLAAWQQGRPALGIALVPAAGESPAASWRVVFNGRGLNGAPHVMSVLAAAGTTAQRSEPGVGAATGPESPASPTAFAATLTGPSSSAPSAALLVGVPDTRGSAGVPAGRTGNVVFTRIPGFKYSAILLLPLALVLGGAWLGRLLTSDATPAGRR